MAIHERRALARLAAAYVALTYAGSWACWLAAWGLRTHGPAAGVAGTLAGTLLVAGTMVPMVVVYALYPRLVALGLAPAVWAGGGAAGARDGFWRFVFGGRSSLKGWLAFLAFAGWRLAFCMVAFGFPSTPGAACEAFVTGLPLLLLGGGFEEVGWRGCLEPALERLLGGCDAARALQGEPCAGPLRRMGLVAAPVLTGVVWAAWHLPLFAIPGTFQSALPFWPILLTGVVLSCSLAVVRAATRSVGACVVGHAWYNALLVQTPSYGLLSVALYAAEALVALALLVRAARRASPGKTP